MLVCPQGSFVVCHGHALAERLLSLADVAKSEVLQISLGAVDIWHIPLTVRLAPVGLLPAPARSTSTAASSVTHICGRLRWCSLLLLPAALFAPLVAAPPLVTIFLLFTISSPTSLTTRSALTATSNSTFLIDIILLAFASPPPCYLVHFRLHKQRRGSILLVDDYVQCRRLHLRCGQLADREKLLPCIPRHARRVCLEHTQ
mmetsp:Transcript_83380/g.156955  ORF Transcript_83380/g.156955 Transcript_83380/m.156955 type:complete len:202 (+) Transcript_83380:1005-1610(+)